MRLYFDGCIKHALQDCLTSFSYTHIDFVQVGYIVMSSVDEACAALKLCEAGSALPCPLSSTNLGLKKWSLHYAKQRKTMTSLEGDAVGVVNSYDRRQYKERLKEKKGGQPDEDGWITVTRKRKSTHSQVSCRPLMYIS